MKKISTLLLSSSLFFSAFAGVSVGNPVVLGTVAQVHSAVHNNPDQLVIDDQTKFHTLVNYYSDNKIIGTLAGYPNSHFTIMTNNGKLDGFIIVSVDKDIAFKYTTNASNEVVLEQVSVNKIMCVNYAINNSNNTQNQQQQKITQSAGLPQAGPVPSLQSRPGSANVLYLDFDGYDLAAGSQWNGGSALTAAPAGYSDAQIRQTWSITAEDYAPFNLNVTTDESVFNAAAKGHRMRMVMTTTSNWSGGGGIAYVDVFTDATETYQPGWIFVDKMGGSAANAGEATSHEAGHTLSLMHHGTLTVGDTVEYYNGHGDWGAIMGAAYGRSMSQFSKGEYTNADCYYIDYQNNNLRVTINQDDLYEISQRVPYLTDDHGNTTANFTEMSYSMSGADGVVDSTSNNGIIGTASDLDAFHFATGGGIVALNFKPSAENKTNLDMQVKLYNSSNTLVNTFSTPHNANTIAGVSINQNLAADDYYVIIDGVGSGDATTGWSDYNSMGPYYITGTIANAAGATGAVTETNSTQGVKIFPNPMNNNGMLTFSATVDAVKVYDLTGKIIYTDTKTSSINLGSQLAQGVYFVETSLNNQTQITKMIH
ncbi:MAG: T9SS type A sorting domain-containing protein [Flavobacteriales bacterium]